VHQNISESYFVGGNQVLGVLEQPKVTWGKVRILFGVQAYLYGPCIILVEDDFENGVTLDVLSPTIGLTQFSMNC
jgi:hypothetical protein